jgi:hypothetical protein
MSSVTAESKKLVLIKNPRNCKERENNKAYYREKFFSSKMKKDHAEKERKYKVAINIIGVRQEYGACGRLACRAGNESIAAEKREWEYKKESMGIVFEKYQKQEFNKNTASSIPTPLPITEPEFDSEPKDANSPECHDDTNTYLNLHQSQVEVVDSWEELC